MTTHRRTMRSTAARARRVRRACVACLLVVSLLGCTATQPHPDPVAASVPVSGVPVLVPSAPVSGPPLPPPSLPLAGLAYGPYHPGQDPNLKIYPSPAEVDADIPTLAALTGKIRIYSSLGPAQEIVKDAERAHLSVNLGIWIGPDRAANEREMAAGLRLMSSPAVDIVTVGNEVLLRKDQTLAGLQGYIQRVRAAARAGHHVQVTTADIYTDWLAHPDLARNVDLVTVHIYPFWEKHPIDGAADRTAAAYRDIVGKFPGKRVVIGETGWPSDGPAQGDAIPSGANQYLYFKQFVAWATANHVDYYYFDAFDEAWKTNEAGVGAHWGLYGQDGDLKLALRSYLPAAAPQTLNARSVRDIYLDTLSAGLGLGIDTSGHQFGWLTADHATLTLRYPGHQAWGAMFITVGQPAPPGNRPSIDLSRYQYLTADIRWLRGGDCVNIGVKDRTQPDDGTEATVPVCPTASWKTMRIPLTSFTNTDTTHLYVVFEIVFPGRPNYIQLRNIRYTST